MNNNTTSDAEDAARRAAAWAAFMAQYVTGTAPAPAPAVPTCLCGKNPATVVHSTKGNCCTECAKS